MNLSRFLDSHPDVVCVRVKRSQGSVPRETGAQMFVARKFEYGTIGGGQLEYIAIDRARSMLRGRTVQTAMDIPLGPEIGQCCGGRVQLTLKRMAAGDKQAAIAAEREHLRQRPHVYVFGAGHVGRALARYLKLLPVRAVLIDERSAELERCTAQVECRQSALPESEVRLAPPGSAFVVLTHDHALDFLVATEALARGDAAYVGMIGSSTKRAKFSVHCKCDGRSVDPALLVCPIGAGHSHDKRPEVIAAFVAAEVIGTLTGNVEDHPVFESRSLDC